MLHITILSYYELKESLLSASNALQAIGYQVDNYPLLRYYADPHDRREDCLEHCIQSLKKSNPHVLLWWYVGVPVNFIRAVKKELDKCFWILNSWDDPYSFSLQNYDKKLKYFDLAISSCKSSVFDYLANGCKDAIYRPPGFDPAIHKPESDIQFEYDISFCCTTLYRNAKDYPSQLVSRYDIVKMLTKMPSIKFGLFGPLEFKQEFPDHYIRFLNYEKTNEIFNKSRINLCTHVVGNQEGYFNERVPLVLGSGGLLMTDDVQGLKQIFRENEHCIYYHSLNELKDKVTEVLNYYEKYEIIKKQGHQCALQNHTWTIWADAVHIKICSRYFDSQFYQNTFNLDKTKATWHSWIMEGRFKKHFPFRYEVPQNFSITRYKKNASHLVESISSFSNDAYVFWHYWMHASNQEKVELISHQSELSTDQSFNLFEMNRQNSQINYLDFISLFNSLMSVYNNNFHALEEVAKITSRNPNFNITQIQQILKHYF